jgi:hypothetical protein
MNGAIPLLPRICLRCVNRMNFTVTFRRTRTIQSHVSAGVQGGLHRFVFVTFAVDLTFRSEIYCRLTCCRAQTRYKHVLYLVKVSSFLTSCLRNSQWNGFYTAITRHSRHDKGISKNPSTSFMLRGKARKVKLGARFEDIKEPLDGQYYCSVLLPWIDIAQYVSP